MRKKKAPPGVQIMGASTFIIPYKEESESMTNIQENAKPRKKTIPPDWRKALFNGGQVGPIEKIQVSTKRIVQVDGILFDLDPPLYQRGPFTKAVSNDPRAFYRDTVRPWLSRHPVLTKAEVRLTGNGLHVILWFAEPVVIENRASAHR